MKTLKSLGVSAAVIVLALTFFSSQSYAEGIEFKSLLQQGLLGAGVGAISAGASGGKAGEGALIGAGTQIIGGSLLSYLTTSQTASPSYYQVGPQTQPVQTIQTMQRIQPVQTVQYQSYPTQTVYVENQVVDYHSVGPRHSSRGKHHPEKHIVRTFNAHGRLIAERSYWA